MQIEEKIPDPAEYCALRITCGLSGGDDVFVWPSLKGKVRGQVIKPFYPQLAEAALKDEEFYDMMPAIEILRMGRAREIKAAEHFLERKIKSV